MACCIVIPAYCPAPSLVDYVAQLLSVQNGPVTVVDDGSGGDYTAVFAALEPLKGCTVLHHTQNRGKGAAIKTAVAWYREHAQNLDGIITADCDGQHAVSDVVRMAQALEESPQALVLGTRTFGPGTPRRGSAGNHVISWVMNALYGIDLTDTQTGLRGLPNRLMSTLETLAGDRYEYELNMLIEANRRCVPFVLVPIETIYFDNNAGSHYRTVIDTLHIVALLSRGLIQYGLSSALSAAVDVVSYAVLVKLVLLALPFTPRLVIAAVAARAVSSVVNYSCNRRLPYVQNARVTSTMPRYYVLWAFQLAASIGLVALLYQAGVDELLAKLLVDLGLAIASYQVQMRWVFRVDQAEKGAVAEEAERL